MKFYRLVLGILTVWRITHFFQAEDGPWDIVNRVRRLAGEGFWGKLLDCFYCLSVWVAAPIALLIGENWFERAFLWPSFSAGAILLERVQGAAPRIPPAPFAEDRPNEQDDGVPGTKKIGDDRPIDSRSPDE